MGASSPARWSRRHLALALAVMILPSVLLIILGWKLFQQDRESAVRQLEERRAEAASLIVSGLDQHLADVSATLDDADARRALVQQAHAAVAVFSGQTVVVEPAGRAAYLPATPPRNEAGTTTFPDADRLEHVERNYAAAAGWYKRFLGSPDPTTRATALIRLARNLDRLGDTEGALAAYDQAIALTGGWVGSVPADLFARVARCNLLATSGQQDALRDALRKEASALVADLQRGRWSVTRTVYDANLLEARACAGETSEHAPVEAEVFADAISRLWEREQHQRVLATPGAPASGHDLLNLPGVWLTVVWTRTGNQFIALLAGAEYVERQWLAPMQPALTLQRVSVALEAPDAAPAGPTDTRRTAGETGLPWTIVVKSLDLDEDMSRLAARRAVWLTGLGILVLLLASATTLSARAVARELTTARLQADFVAAVSHEFRTPLTTLRQLTETLCEARVPSDERRQSYYHALLRQTDRLQRLVESLLDFGRMEAGRSAYQMEVTSLRSLAQHVAEQYAADARARGVAANVEVVGLDAPARIDRTAFGHALWNLLDNAVKYSPDGHAVRLEIDRVGPSVALRVRDRGIGIPADEQRDIFQKFVRGSWAKANGVGGTGIGLAIVSHIVSTHGGKVTVESTPGTGSTFTVWLPAVTPPTAIPSLHAPHPHR